MVRLTDCPDMTLDVYRGRKTTMQCNPYTKFDVKSGLRVLTLITPGKYAILFPLGNKVCKPGRVRAVRSASDSRGPVRLYTFVSPSAESRTAGAS